MTRPAFTGDVPDVVGLGYVQKKVWEVWAIRMTRQQAKTYAKRQGFPRKVFQEPERKARGLIENVFRRRHIDAYIERFEPMGGLKDGVDLNTFHNPRLLDRCPTCGRRKDTPVLERLYSSSEGGPQMICRDRYHDA